MVRAVVILALVAVKVYSQADPDNIASDGDFPKFQEFLQKHRGGMGYTTEAEMVGRFNTFKFNLRCAEERNARAEKLKIRPGVKRESHGITQFMDLTPQEFQAKYTGLRPTKNKTAGAM